MLPLSCPFGTAIQSIQVRIDRIFQGGSSKDHLLFSVSDSAHDIVDMPTSFKIYWWFNNMTLVISICITIIYWGILFDDTHELNAVNVMTHGTNSLLMFLDMMIVSHPYRLLHVIQPIILGVVYAIFSVIYYFAGGVDV